MMKDKSKQGGFAGCTPQPTMVPASLMPEGNSCSRLKALLGPSRLSSEWNPEASITNPTLTPIVRNEPVIFPAALMPAGLTKGGEPSCGKKLGSSVNTVVC